MSRLTGLLLLLLLVILLFPPVREELKPYAKPVLDPVYEYSAKNRVKTLLKLVQEEEILGRPMPTPRNFAAFVEQRDLQENASQDPWGQPYYLRVLRRGYYVGSPGRDMVRFTPDDIVSDTVRRRESAGSRR